MIKHLQAAYRADVRAWNRFNRFGALQPQHDRYGADSMRFPSILAFEMNIGCYLPPVGMWKISGKRSGGRQA